MKAVVLTGYGDVDNLEVRDLFEPNVGPGEIRVRMAGASVNPIDWKLRSGALRMFMPLVLPTILGRDASGVVVEVGAAVSRFDVGARVMGLVAGAYAEMLVAPADAWVEVPSTMNLVQAAALPLVLLTGAQLVEEAVGARSGDVLLITGALGSVGRVAVYVAKARGVRVWAGVRRSQRVDATGLGVDGVVALDDEDAIDRLPWLDGVADTVGGAAVARVLRRVKPGGVVGSVVGEPAGAKARGLVVRAMLTHPDAARLGALARAVADGRLVVPIAKTLPLSRAAEAQTLAEHHPGGKVVLTGPLHLVGSAAHA